MRVILALIILFMEFRSLYETTNEHSYLQIYVTI